MQAYLITFKRVQGDISAMGRALRRVEGERGRVVDSRGGEGPEVTGFLGEEKNQLIRVGEEGQAFTERDITAYGRKNVREVLHQEGHIKDSGGVCRVQKAGET